MECREVRPLVEAFVSEQLLVETTGAIVAHLERCPACRAELAGVQRLRTAVRSAIANSSALDARPEFLLQLGARVRAEAARPAHPAQPRRAWLAIAAALLLLLAGGLGWRAWSVRSLSALVNAAAGDHRFCTLTVKITKASISLEDAAARYGAFNRTLESVEPPHDGVDGVPIRILERHSCLYGGQRFAHIELQYRDQIVSVLVSDTGQRSARVWGLVPSGAQSASFPVTDGFHVAAFRGSDHLVFVVSTLPDDDVRSVARAMAGPVTRALAGA